MKVRSLIEKAQQTLMDLSAHPYIFAGTFLVIGLWIGASFASGGHIDPGLVLVNVLINFVSLELGFSANANAKKAADAGSLHERFDALHSHIEEVHDTIKE